MCWAMQGALLLRGKGGTLPLHPDLVLVQAFLARFLQQPPNRSPCLWPIILLIYDTSFRVIFLWNLVQGVHLDVIQGLLDRG